MSTNRTPRQLIKWIGSKHRCAEQILRFFPSGFRRYYEPFFGGGSVLGALAPASAVASDVLAPLMGIWRMVRTAPDELVAGYRRRWEAFMSDRRGAYGDVQRAFNLARDPVDLLFLCRTCYGGVVRFRRQDGAMTTSLGDFSPIPPDEFARRVQAWRPRVAAVDLRTADFEPVMAEATRGDLIYCDPPYAGSQRIIYGAHEFSIERLLQSVEGARSRGAHVALSLQAADVRHGVDRAASSGDLFRRCIPIDRGGTMLRRLHSRKEPALADRAADRLLLTW